jgi:hypothetical protein
MVGLTGYALEVERNGLWVVSEYFTTRYNGMTPKVRAFNSLKNSIRWERRDGGQVRYRLTRCG